MMANLRLGALLAITAWSVLMQGELGAARMEHRKSLFATGSQLHGRNLSGIQRDAASNPIVVRDSFGRQSFHPIMGFNCVHERFIRIADTVTTPKDCATACNKLRDCQAFSTSDGRCKMFVFNKCSKNVRECRCYRLTRVFVRMLPGLMPGALCPLDFGHSNCGVKYKFIHDATTFDAALEKCSAEPGLTIMTEPINMDKFNYLLWLYDNRYKRPSDPLNFYLGGSQDPGSAEPAGGWHWTTCRLPIAADMWEPGQPTNGGHYAWVEDFACSWRREATELTKLNDCPSDESNRHTIGTYCECVSPFD